LIDDGPKKSIFNNTRIVVFLKSWKHIIKNSTIDAYLSKELGLWLKKLQKEGKEQVPKYLNKDQLGVNPLVSGDFFMTM
jgi:hypothetical protein